MKKLVVGCDLFLDLKLYRVPPACLDHLKKNLPSVTLQEINTARDVHVDYAAVEVYWGNRITRDIINRLPNLKWIHFGSIGVNRANVPEVLERKIVVTNSKGTMENAVAVTAFGFLLLLARGFHRCASLQAQKNLSRETFDAFFENIHDLEGQKCLIVGFGDVGQKVARMGAAAGLKISAVKKDTTRVPQGVERLCDLDDLGNAVQDADYVVNLLPLTDGTSGVFDKSVFSKMQPSAFFINVGRGETVKEEDLIQALTERCIAGAGLDVFEREPLPEGSKLWGLPNVVMTPHVAGLSNRYWDREYALFFENLKRYIHGESLKNVVDLAKGY